MKYALSRSRRRLVEALRVAAEAHEELAKAYRKLGWDLESERTASNAAEFRRRMESIKQGIALK